MIVEHKLESFPEITWYVVSVRFASAYMARETWERIDERAGKKHLDLGLYRHGPSDDPGRFLTAVTHNRQSALVINREVRGVEPNGLSADEIEAFILRRIDVLAARDFQPGVVRARHPESRGAKLNPDGSMELPSPPHG